MTAMLYGVSGGPGRMDKLELEGGASLTLDPWGVTVLEEDPA